MNALGPPEQKRARAKSAFRELRLRSRYHSPLLLQAFASRSRRRRCVACEERVTNKNLGGNDGRSALIGSVWCYECADWPQQLLLRLEDI